MDLKYPVELHKAHNGYPLAPEKKKRIENGWMSDYQKSMVHELGLKQNKKRTCFDTTGQKKIM